MSPLMHPEYHGVLNGLMGIIIPTVGPLSISCGNALHYINGISDTYAIMVCMLLPTCSNIA